MALESDHPVSPRSSSGVEESLRGTPDTRTTSASQQGTETRPGSIIRMIPLSVPDNASPIAALPSDQQYVSGVVPERDPFLTPHHFHRRLSPTASAFNPFMRSSRLIELEQTAPIATALSTELGLSRCLSVSAAEPLAVEQVGHWLNNLEIHGRQFYGYKRIDTAAEKALVQFDDIRDACSVLTAIVTSNQGWKVEYCGSSLSDQQLTSSGLQTLTSGNGQVLVMATIARNVNSDLGQVFNITRNFLHSYGRLFAFIEVSNSPKGSLKAVAEFCDISHSTKMMTNCTHATTPEGVHLAISPYNHSDAWNSSLGTILRNRSGATQGSSSHMRKNLSPVPRSVLSLEGQANQQYTMYPLMLQSPFVANVPYILDSMVPACSQGHVSPVSALPPTYPVLGPLYHAPPSPALTVQNNFSPSRAVPGFFRPDGRRQNATRIARSPYNGSSNHHNFVDINRIREGIDVRTTIMLRNIPNKVDQAMLKRIIDDSSWGKYDFMYLRIDFANDCNVGYAFINFVDPLDIIDFVEVRGNQRWNCFKSDKVAEISYATIQGKDCLVQKFRNSSVMLEAPHYRPKLYFTCNGPRPGLAGQEEPFPDPDNQSKMKRSCENAEHVGLFTPNAGQHYRDEQRRRRSQYDRGTRLAALEEYDFDAAMQNFQNLYINTSR
ncbi:hypothetical protein QQS21_001055 [Conoideocrella luteorostrata]|uniref:RRM domain-containing protein n=1 Tax=Conoideocrella luteorostrata TaxID=1105319 RepID=A0AAJ0G2C5_9HYPO|nr:hypothetical protein QQS21_001055 [Conoideocrella luteorostrata]